MQFRPLHDRVVIAPLDREEITAGGIIVPDTVQEKPMRGKVLVTGPGARGEDGALLPMEVKRGDTVLYGKFSGSEVKIDDTDVLIMREGDVMGIIG